ncbi:MAG: hypothetical protein ACLUFN_04805 [Eubacterium sp.]
MFDIKDITDILPFILENLSVTSYIMIISIILGFFIGKLITEIKFKNKIKELQSQVSNQENDISGLTTEKEELENRLNQLTEENESIKGNSKLEKLELLDTNFISLSALEKLINSKEGKIELTALIELNYNKDNNEIKENNEN